MTTGVKTLQAGAEPHSDPSRPSLWRSRRAFWVVCAFAALHLVGGVAGLVLVRVPYYAIQPGRTFLTNDLVVLPADRRIEPKGKVFFVTVGLRRLQGVADYVLAKRDDDVLVVPESLILGTDTPQQYRQRATQDMVDSKEIAAIVALDRLCFDVQEIGTGARIVNVVKDSPAAAAGIQPEDTITAIGTKTVEIQSDLLDVLRASKPGAPFDLTVVGPADGAEPRRVTGRLGTNPEDPKVTSGFLGVQALTRARDFRLPFDVGVDSGPVGGPSAGLAFTLALIDQLTPGELTGGRNIAATGTIELDGRVGLVGGVPQKAVAVRKGGAALFLVPKGEEVEADAKLKGSVEVVPVETLEDALAALKARGGDVSGVPDSCPGS